MTSPDMPSNARNEEKLITGTLAAGEAVVERTVVVRLRPVAEHPVPSPRDRELRVDSYRPHYTTPRGPIVSSTGQEM